MIDKIEIIKRANGCCEYCKYPASFSPAPFVMEHIIPLSRGGDDAVENMAFACSGCNGHKYAKTSALDPLTREVVALYHPRNQKWNAHFQWSPDKVSVEGITATGRATIEALHLNRPEVVNFRKIAMLIGKHPPVEG